MNPTDTDYDILLAQVKALQELNAKLITDNGELLTRINRIETFAAGRGMVSEAANIDEIAVLVCGLHDKIQRLETEAGVMKAALDERRGLMEWPLRAEMRD